MLFLFPAGNMLKSLSLFKKLIGNSNSSLEALVEKNTWTRLGPIDSIDPISKTDSINRIQLGETILILINKLVSMMFLKWVQSDQSVTIGSNYFLLQGNVVFLIISAQQLYH